MNVPAYTTDFLARDCAFSSLWGRIPAEHSRGLGLPRVPKAGRGSLYMHPVRPHVGTRRVALTP